MQISTKNLKFNKVDENGSAPPKSEEQPATPPGNPPPKEEGAETDDFGYGPQVPEEGAPPAPGDKPAEKPVEEGEPEPVAGYHEEPKVEEEKPDEKPADPPPAPTEIDKALEGLVPDEVAVLKAFAEKHKLTPEVVKDYADIRRKELKAAEDYAANAEKEQQKALLKQRADWHKELKEDKDFGGENFDKNRVKVDKLLNEFMPSTKKRLTETKGMLAPYLMRDLKALADKLHETGKLVVGNPTPPAKTDEPDDGTSFYT